MPDLTDLVKALRPVVDELDRLGVRYCVGGSVASSFHGAARSTFDVDLSAELDESSAVRLVQALSKDYYASESAARDAVRRRSCFNLIHLSTSYKVDIFVRRDRPFDSMVQDRALSADLGETEPLRARIVSPEDILLLKLEWYKIGGGTSERQWTDVTRVATLHRSKLDRAYMQHWASELGVADLLARLLAEVDG